MGNLLYIIAVILIISWAIGFFGYHAGGIIHVLLVIAIIAFLQGDREGLITNPCFLKANHTGSLFLILWNVRFPTVSCG